MVGNAQAATHEHDHSHHHGAAASGALTLAISDCIQKGEVCLNHCIDLLGQARRNGGLREDRDEALAVCGALQQLANQNSKQLARMAAIAMDVCSNARTSARSMRRNTSSARHAARAVRHAMPSAKKIAPDPRIQKLS